MPFRFLKFPVYNHAKQFHKEIYKITKLFPVEEKYGLISQIRRASMSILLNIAEGSDRGSDKEFNRFLMISLGSLNEVVACLDIALCNNYINQQTFNYFYKKAEELSNQLAGFSKILKNS